MNRLIYKWLFIRSIESILLPCRKKIWIHNGITFLLCQGELIWKKLKTIFENLPDIQMERFCTSLKSGDVAQLAVICYHSARTVQEWDGYAFDEVTFQKLGDEYEVGLTRKYRSFQNTATTYRLKLNCLDPENTPFPSGYSEWLMDVGDESSDYDGTYMEAYNLRQEDVPVIGLPFGETFDRDPVKMTESLRRFFDLAENPVPPWQMEPSLLLESLLYFWISA